MTKIAGGCHCGAIRFEAEGEFANATECNCAHCSKKSFLLAFVPQDHFTLTVGEGAYTTYYFNEGIINHNFCATRGVQAFGYGVGPDGVQMAGINMRGVDNIDTDALYIQAVDGKSL